MENLGTQVCHLLCFPIGDLSDCGSTRYQAWIGGHQAIHVGPDDHFVGVESSAQNRRGTIRAASTKSREHALRSSADKASHHGNDPLSHEWTQALLTELPGHIHVRVGSAVAGV